LQVVRLRKALSLVPDFSVIERPHSDQPTQAPSQG
jgi:hypothetical protein